jgi:hypothetical protein
MSESDVLTGQTIEGRLVQGPGILFPLGEGGFENCGWGAPDRDFEALLWEVDPDVRPVVVGAVGIRKTTFRNCDFEGIGIARDAGFLRYFKARIHGYDVSSRGGAAAATHIYAAEVTMGDRISVGDVVNTGGGQVAIGHHIFPDLRRTGNGKLAEVLSEIGTEVAKPEPNVSRLRRGIEGGRRGSASARSSSRRNRAARRKTDLVSPPLSWRSGDDRQNDETRRIRRVCVRYRYGDSNPGFRRERAAS